MVVVLILISIVLQLWNSDHGHVVEACKNSLKKLQLDYLDLYLVHFPIASKHSGANIYPVPLIFVLLLSAACTHTCRGRTLSLITILGLAGKEEITS